MNDDLNLIQPLRSSIAVSVHPHKDGDVVSVAVVAGNDGRRYLIALDLDTAEHLSTLLKTAVKSPKIAAAASELRDR